MNRVIVILIACFGVFLAGTVAAVALPFRHAGPWMAIRLVATFVSFSFGIAWAVLSLFAIPRAIGRLVWLSHHPAGAGDRAIGVLALLLALVPLLAVLVATTVAWRVIGFRMPGRSYQGALPPLTAVQQSLCADLRATIRTLARDIGDRNVSSRYTNLCAAADFIQRSFESAGYEVHRQSYVPAASEAAGRACFNLDAERPGAVRPEEIVIVGAHYDTVPGTGGANDNGSGVAATLALARAFAAERPARTVRFVAFANEEPPFFQTGDMGSLVYAKRCRERGEKVVAMLSLETIGCYSDERESQQYPLRLFTRFYPDTGNFIGFIGNPGSRRLAWDVAGSFRRHARFPSEAAVLPSIVSGVGWSDHWSFWQAGYQAVMVTDTAPFRYLWYHTAQDSPDKLDYERMARVVAGLAAVVTDLAGSGSPPPGS